MGLGCGAGCLKWMLIIVNILFFMAGAAALGLGIWMAVDEAAFDILGITNPEGMDYTVWKITVYTMIGTGAFIFLVAGIGMVGACCQNRCLIMTYSVLGGVALAAEITCAVLALVYQDEINEGVAWSMYDDLVNGYTVVDDTDNSYVSTWNNFQSTMKCCGSYNYTDWYANENYGLTVGLDPVPWTCCEMSTVHDPPLLEDVVDVDACYLEGDTNDPAQQQYFTSLHDQGCYHALVVWVDDKSVIIYGVMFGLMGLQLLTMIFGCMFYCALDHGHNYA